MREIQLQVDLLQKQVDGYDPSDFATQEEQYLNLFGLEFDARELGRKLKGLANKEFDRLLERDGLVREGLPRFRFKLLIMEVRQKYGLPEKQLNQMLERIYTTEESLDRMSTQGQKNSKMEGAEEVVEEIEIIDDASEEPPERVEAVGAGYPGLGLGGREMVEVGSYRGNLVQSDEKGGDRLPEGRSVAQAKHFALSTQVKGNMVDEGAEEATSGGVWQAEEVVEEIEVIDDASEEPPERVEVVGAGHPGLGLGGKERVEVGSHCGNLMHQSDEKGGERLTEGRSVDQANHFAVPTQVKGNMGTEGAEEVMNRGLWQTEEVVEEIDVWDDASEEALNRVEAGGVSHPGLGLGQESVEVGIYCCNLDDKYPVNDKDGETSHQHKITGAVFKELINGDEAGNALGGDDGAESYGFCGSLVTGGEETVPGGGSAYQAPAIITRVQISKKSKTEGSSLLGYPEITSRVTVAQNGSDCNKKVEGKVRDKHDISKCDSGDEYSAQVMQGSDLCKISLCMSALHFVFGILLSFTNSNSRTSIWTRKKKFNLAFSIAVFFCILCPTHCSGVKVTDLEDSGINNDAKAISPQIPDIPSFDDDLEQLKKIDSHLRGATPESNEVDAADMLSAVREVVSSYLSKINIIRGHIHDGNTDGAGAAIKSSINNAKDFINAKKEYINHASTDPSSSALHDNSLSITNLHNIPNSQLAEFTRPEFFDDIGELAENLVDSLDSMDLSSLPPRRTHSNIDPSGSNDANPGFDFSSQPNFEQYRSRINGQWKPFSSNMPNLNIYFNQHRSSAGNEARSMHQGSKFGSFFQNDATVLAKHELRVAALGGEVCEPTCNLDDKACICKRLFECAKKMSAYDLAVLTVYGYIDTNPSAKTFGNFTLPGNDLNMFYDDVAEKLERIHKAANGNDFDSENACLSLLEEFHTACHTGKSSCSKANDQSFQVTVGQVCDVVDSPRKLLFEVLGDHFDGFVDESAEAKCNPLSYDTCAEFVQEFDRLYEARDESKYPQPNPMRTSPSVPLHDKTTQDIFQHATFPIGYTFPQDERGVVDRSFEGFVSQPLSQPFNLVNPTTDMALGLSGRTDCNDLVLVVENHDEENTRQQFRLVNNDKIESVNCPGKYLTVGSGRCRNGTSIDSSQLEMATIGGSGQQWRFNRDGTITNAKCTNYAVSPGWDKNIEEDVSVNYGPVGWSSGSLHGLAEGSLSDPEAMLAGGKVTIKSKSGDIWKHADSFFFSSISVSMTEFSFEVYMEGWGTESVHQWAKFGLMVRDDLTDDSVNFGLFLAKGYGGCVFAQWRESESYTTIAAHQRVCEFSTLLDDGAHCSSDSQCKSRNCASVERPGGWVDICESGSAPPPTLDNYMVCTSHSQCKSGKCGTAYELQRNLGHGGGWLKIQRNGNDFSAFFRRDTDSEYILIGNKNMDMNGHVHIGVALSSNDVNTQISSTFSSFSVKPFHAILMERTSEFKPAHEFRPVFFATAGYNSAQIPGFPGSLVDGCLSSTDEKELAKSAMGSCDESMKLLVGSQVSVGTLRDIAALVNGANGERNRPDLMPGTCCMDTATTSAFFGYNYDPNKKHPGTNEMMPCMNPGPWHLGISKEACENAGGDWFKSDCKTLKKCIDDRPPRFDLSRDAQFLGIHTSYVAVPTSHANFTFGNDKHGCQEFCEKLPSASSQTGMVTLTNSGSNDVIYCMCLYKEGKAPSIELIGKNALRSPPMFYIKSPMGTALGLAKNSDCSADELSVEVQEHVKGSPRQQFGLSLDGNIVSALCPKHVMATNGFQTKTAFEDGQVELQRICREGEFLKTFPRSNARFRWDFNTSDRTISAIDCPAMVISGIKDDATLISYYFALKNPQSNLVMGIVGTECQGEMDIELQKPIAGSPSQQFKKEGDKIASVMCPGLFVEVPDKDSCQSALHLSKGTDTSANTWIFRDNDAVESMTCEKYISIDMSNSSSTTPTTLSPTRSPTAAPSRSPLMDKDLPEYSSIETKKVPFSMVIPPEVGSKLHLTDLDGSAKYQKWVKTHERFRALEGPFSLVHLGRLSMHATQDLSGQEIGLEARNDDYSDESQKFYLGKHNSIFSLRWPGMVIAIDECSNLAPLKLSTYVVGDDKMKWTFKQDGTIENKMCQGMGIHINETNGLVLKNSTTERLYKWQRQNARILPTTAGDLTQDWTVEFDAAWYSKSDAKELLLVNGVEEDTEMLANIVGAEFSRILYYPPNPAFSNSFNDFAKDLVIGDASDEKQCGHAREELGFDKDHPFDTEVCHEFHDHMCDQFFTGVDHQADELAAAPEFEYIEYKEVEYKDVEYEAPEYTDDPDLGKQDLNEPPEWLPEKAIGTNGRLGGLQDGVLAAEAILRKSKALWEYVVEVGKAMCKKTGDYIQGVGIGFAIAFVPNPARVACGTFNAIFASIYWGIYLASDIAYEVINPMYEKATLGADQAIDGYLYSKATFDNMDKAITWQYRSMRKINENMQDQHTAMRQHLQARHLAMETNIGQDINDARNAIGQLITDAQNANGQLIVDAQNEISRQHNILGKWMHDNLPRIYEAVGGMSEALIGPLEEGQEFIPINFHWPEGQPTLMEKLYEVEVRLQSILAIAEPSGGSKIVGLIGGESGAEGLGGIKVDVPEAKLDAIGKSGVDAINGKIDGLEEFARANVNAIEGKVNAIEGKVNAIEGKVNAIEGNMKDIKDMILHLINSNEQLKGVAS